MFYTKKIKELEQQIEDNESEINNKFEDIKVHLSNVITNTYKPSYTESIQCNNNYNNTINNETMV